MFENLRQAFRQAVENFHAELNRDSLPEATDRLLSAMSREVVDARLRLDELREEITRVRDEAKREEEAARTCVRREELAASIGDTETQEVARQFALRHLRRKEVLEEKAKVLEREVGDRGAELEEMMAQLKEARVRREAMSASAGRTGARESLREADDLFSQLDRMEDRIRDLESEAGAAEAMDELELGGAEDAIPRSPSASRSRAPSDQELEARLAELKRRMSSE